MLNVTYQIQHLTLKANDNRQMRRFYRDILELVETKIDAQTYTYAFTQNTTPFLTLVFNGQVPTSPRQGLYHFALLLPDTASLASLIEHLLLINYPMGGGDHDVSEAFYLNDPDGNGIELYHDRPKSEWVWDSELVKMGTKDVDVMTLLKAKQSLWAGFSVDTTLGHLHFVGHDLKVGDAFFVADLNMSLTAIIANSAHFYSHNRYHHHHAYNTWLGPQASQRQTQETGLVDWTISVNTAYFNQLKAQFAGRSIVDNAHTLRVIDPFGSTLFIKTAQPE